MGLLRDYNEVLDSTVYVTNSLGEDTGRTFAVPDVIGWYAGLYRDAEAGFFLPYLTRCGDEYHLSLLLELEHRDCDSYDESIAEWVPASYDALTTEEQHCLLREAAAKVADRLASVPGVAVFLGIETGIFGRDELVVRCDYPSVGQEGIRAAVAALDGLSFYGGD